MEVIHKISEEGRKKGCPTGQCCDVCNLYRPTYRQTKDGDVVQEFDCQWNNLAMLLDEAKNRMTGVQHAVESGRNETVKRQDRLLNIVEGAQRASLPRQ